MENPREIANVIKLFEESFEDVERFLQNYKLGLGDDGDVGKPNDPTPSESIPAGGKQNGSSRPRTVVADGKDNNVGEESEHRHRGSCQELSSLDQAKKDLVDAYAINSIFWMYLCVQGIDPRNHHIKHELDRIRKYMNLIKEATEKQNAPKLNVKASKRLIRGAMFDTSESSKKAKKEKQTS